MNLEEKLKLQQQHIRNQRQQLETLRERVGRLESMLEFCIVDPQVKWLFANRQERMDPGVPLFDPGRAGFHQDRYRFAANYAQAGRVADIACGTGYGVRILLEEGRAASVIGIDIDAEAIRYASERHAPEGASYRCTEGASTGIADDSLDLVVSFETIEHVEDDAALISEFARVLRPGGRLVCSTPNEWPLTIAPHHVREYNRDSFLNALQSKFGEIELFNQNSGTRFQFNREQPRGIVATTDDNHRLAECFIAVASN